jgi:hypothetical protein
MDFMGALPKLTKETRGKDFNIIMIIVNRLTKYAYFKPIITNIIIPETAKIFIEKIITQYRQPDRITLDQDKLFMSKFWKALIE